MSVLLRMMLIFCAGVVLFSIVRRLKKSQIQVMDSAFWLFFAFSFCIFAVFPQLAYWISAVFGFASPSNFIFLYVISILVIHDFSATVQIAELRKKINALVIEVAFNDVDRDNSEHQN